MAWPGVGREEVESEGYESALDRLEHVTPLRPETGPQSNHGSRD